MAVTTVLVCDSQEKTEELKVLIAGQSDLSLVAAVSYETASDQIQEFEPNLVWLELGAEPQQSLTRLGKLKEKYPNIIFVVSCDSLKADLVKSAMQLGALEYFDPRGVSRLLPDAISRIQQKLATAPPPKPPVEQISDELPSNPNAKPVTGVRSIEAQIEGGPDSIPFWLLPSIMVALMIAAVVLACVKGLH